MLLIVNWLKVFFEALVKFRNNTGSEIYRHWCRLYSRERFENNTWKKTGEPPCPGGSLIYIGPNGLYVDTIKSYWLEEGKYRLVTDVSVENVNKTIHSNEFNIKE